MHAIQKKTVSATLHATYSWFHVNTPGMTIHQEGPFTCLYSPNRILDFNMALPTPSIWPDTCTDVDDALEARSALFDYLEAVHAFYAKRNSPWVCLIPSWGEERKEEAEPRFPDSANLGFSKFYDSAGKHIELANLHLPDSYEAKKVPPKAPACSIRRASRPEDIDAFVGLLQTGWDVDFAPLCRFFQSQAERILTPDYPKQFYIAWVDGRPASCLEVFFNQDTSTISIDYVATHHDFRQQGLNTLLWVHVLSASRKLGYKHAIVMTLPTSARLASNLGLSIYGYWREYHYIN